MTKPSKSGKVYLVGAGPGDPGLLTLKGKECLEAADVVLYDYLANPFLLQYAPATAQRIYVGRRGRGQYQDQADINRLLIERAKEGNVVIRLKGGDPFVFGRGGEEAEAVAAAGVDFELVPGVTAAVAVPAYAGIPVTHRTLASTVTFVTGHEDPTKPVALLEWPKLASTSGTLVFMMGMKNLPLIVRQLLLEGRPSDTPVATIRWGTKAAQQTIVGTLGDIVSKAEAAHLEPPTVIVVGEVVRLRGQLNWFETKPLFGKRVVLTRPQEQAREFSQLLAAYGAEPVEVPTIQLVPPASWQAIDDAMTRLSTYQWLIFTSVNGVRPFMDRLHAAGKDARALANLRLCAIGPRTAKELGAYGLTPDVIPNEFQAEGVIAALASVGIRGSRILIPRAEVAREILPDQLRELGATVEVIPVYRTIVPAVDIASLTQQLQDGQVAVVTFTSSSTVRNFVELFGGRDRVRPLLAGTVVACIGPITARTAEEYGVTVTVMPAENTVPALAEAIVKYFKEEARVAVSTRS
ncbi:MAG TPA: uroporphyrinogen-III C-methyltransferase [Nitrospiraceae bacterium]|nr:uroporphyrinogen-III C-methyltransferase [Nitrospiraceae bacterium]